MKNLLVVQRLYVSAGSKSIIKGLSLSVKPGELHILMGPNGSGKSTFAYALMGYPQYAVRCTKLFFNNRDIRKLAPEKRAQLGMFLGFQHPVTITGITLAEMLTAVVRSRESKRTYSTKRAVLEKLTSPLVKRLRIKDEMLYRNINEGFSGGEKKKSEVLQMLMLKPRLAILDEPDSGLDVDALKVIARAINEARRSGTAIILITHYERILRYVTPDKVHVLRNGTIVTSGGPALVRSIEQHGYERMLVSNHDQPHRNQKDI